MIDTSSPSATPIKYAAQSGLILGGYMVLCYSFWMFTPSYPLLIFPYIISLLLTPLVSFIQTRNYRDKVRGGKPFPFALAWAYGTQSFIFASIVLMLPAYIYYAKALPSQLPALETLLQEVYRQSPEVKGIFRQMYGGDPIDVLYNWLGNSSVWLNVWNTFSTSIFLGALASIVNALILKRSYEHIA